MQSGCSSNPRANASTHDSNGNGGGGGGSLDGRGQPYRPPAAQEVTPQEKEQVLLAAGRLAAEYLVSRGDLPPDVLDNRPAPLLPPSRLQPRGFHFQGRPPAPQQQRQFQWELRPYVPQRRQPWQCPFRGGRGGPGPFPKQPRHAAARPYPYGGGARGPAPPKLGYYTGHGAAAPATAWNVQEGNGNSAPAGDTSEPEPTAQPANGVTSSATQQMNQPSSKSLGDNDIANEAR